MGIVFRSYIGIRNGARRASLRIKTRAQRETVEVRHAAEQQETKWSITPSIFNVSTNGQRDLVERAISYNLV